MKIKNCKKKGKVKSMGIDYFVCRKCGRAFPDVCDYVDCSDNCSSLWCCDKCADEDGLIYEDCKLGYDIEFVLPKGRKVIGLVVVSCLLSKSITLAEIKPI